MVAAPAPSDSANSDTAQVDELVETMRMLQRRMSRMPIVVEERFGLAANRFQAMVVIDSGAARVQDVARMTWTSVSAASRTVDALVQDGMVDRRPDPEDRRATILTLTPGGQRRVDEVHTWRTEWMSNVVAALGPDRTTCLIDGLTQFGIQLDDMVEAAQGPRAD